MSRRVNLNRPLTDEDKEYLLTRSNGQHLITINERQFEGYDKKQKEEISKAAQRDEEEERRHEEARIEAEIAADDDDESYHPEDIAQVSDLTTAQLRQRLSKEGLKNTVSEEELKLPNGETISENDVLAYRLLDHLDEKRKG